MNVGGEGPTLVLDGHQVLGDHRKQNAERKTHFKSPQLKKRVTGTKKNPKNKWNLTAAPSPRSCPLLEPAPVHLGSSARCAAASGRTAASSWCTDPGRTSPAGRRQRCLVKGNATSCCTLKLNANASCWRYLLHGENIFGGSCVLQQAVELHLRPDLSTHTQEAMSGIGNSWQPSRKWPSLTSLLSSEASEFSSLSADIVRLVVLQTNTTLSQYFYSNHSTRDGGNSFHSHVYQNLSRLLIKNLKN